MDLRLVLDFLLNPAATSLARLISAIAEFLLSSNAPYFTRPTSAPTLLWAVSLSNNGDSSSGTRVGETSSDSSTLFLSYTF